MDVRFRTRQPERSFPRESESIRAYGPVVGRQYVRRIVILQSAPNLQALFAEHRLDFHPLTEDRQGQSALRLTGRYRLIVTVEFDTLIVEEVSSHYE